LRGDKNIYEMEHMVYKGGIKSMNRKGKILVGIMVVIVVLVSSCLALWKLNKQPESPSSTYRVEYTLEETSEGWYINITNTIREDGSIIEVYEFKAEDVGYLLIGSNYSTSGRLTKINGTPSLDYNITWNDIDNNGILSIGDNFFISKIGGTSGVAKHGDRFIISYVGCETEVILWTNTKQFIN
jgi:hypothetical protein